MRFFLAAVLLPAAVFAQATAELSGDAVEVQFTVRGTPQKQLRVHKGGAMTLKLSGPADLTLELRIEALAPRPEPMLVERDGKLVTLPSLNTAVDPTVRSDKGQALSRPTSISVPVPAGKHTVMLRWPPDAAGDALVLVGGATVVAPLPELALPMPLPAAPLPLPAPAAEPAMDLAPLTGSRAAAAPSAGATVQPEPRTRIITAVPAAAEGPQWHRFDLDLRAGAQRSAESYTDPSAMGSLGAELAFRIKPLWPVALSLDLGFSHQGYQALQLSPGGRTLAQTALDEQRVDTVLYSGWDLGPWLRKDGRLVTLPYLGFQYSALRNGGFPLDLFGIAAGVRARWALSPSFGLKAGLRWTYNLLKGSTLSAVGTPVSDLLLEASLSLPLPGGYAVDLGYRGDVLALNYDTRVAHGMSLGVETAF